MMNNQRKAVLAVILYLTTQGFISQALAQKLAPEEVAGLVKKCAPTVHPNTMLKVLKHESGFNPYVIGVNATPRQVHKPQSKAEAATIARELIGQGKSIDMGLGQINSDNLPGLQLTPEQIFDPCTNVQAAALILTGAYRRARTEAGSQSAALDQALSRYNTGKPDKGIANGYVGLVRAAQYEVPALDADAPPPPTQEAQPVAEEGPPPEWDVFARARYRGPRAKPETAQALQAAPAAAPAAPVMLFQENR